MLGVPPTTKSLTSQKHLCDSFVISSLLPVPRNHILLIISFRAIITFPSAAMKKKSSTDSSHRPKLPLSSMGPSNANLSKRINEKHTIQTTNHTTPVVDGPSPIFLGNQKQPSDQPFKRPRVLDTKEVGGAIPPRNLARGSQSIPNLFHIFTLLALCVSWWSVCFSRKSIHPWVLVLTASRYEKSVQDVSTDE